MLYIVVNQYMETNLVLPRQVVSGSARAALSLGTGLGTVGHLRHNLKEGRLHLDETRRFRSLAVRVGVVDGLLSVVLLVTGAALRLTFGVTGGFLASKLALGLGAERRLAALPVTTGLFADGRALGFGGDALGVALSGGTDGLALGARLLLAHILGASDGADRFLTVNGALGAGGLLALHLTTGTLANGVAHSGAHGVITLPSTGRVTLSLRGKERMEGEEKG